MPLYREDNFLVVHPGSEHTLFSFGLQDSLSPPEYKIPSVVYQNPVSKEYSAKKPEDSIEELSEIHPIKGSKIVDFEAFKYLLKTVLHSIIASNPIITINQIPLLLVIPSVSWSRLQLESITKYVIESLEFSAFNVLDLSIAANFGIGNGTNSLVVNLGKDATQVSAIVNCQNIKFASKFLDVGSELINQELAKLLPNFTATQIEALKTSNIFEVVVNDDESFYSRSDLKQPVDDNFDVAKIVVEGENGVGKTEEESETTLPNQQLEKNTFTDPETSEKVVVGKERFQGTEKLVGILSKTIYNVLEQIPDLERKQECYNNLIFVGSTFKIPGFKDALLTKLHEDVLIRTPSQQAANEASGINSAIAAYQQAEEVAEPTEGEFVIAQVPTALRTAKYPEYFPEWKKPKELGGSWENVFFLGGQIYAKQIFGGNSNINGEFFVDSTVYSESGPQAIWNAAI
ncbi:Actin-like protein arp9 (SWI/SNF complex component arp9) [Yamadazyma tenuis]|uniref:Actin-like ATPase domain-containing protein n=1 Tax=Candida tenuis (strain ATCC 10573 / BCRC 21748 / CBS 615 / JCM 9827 / NBRC 10315 / NRRL Y-1498 / VKM Y-70) TaxID=590646 RepID=G3B3P0_CANTC|nr:actin-like ATPase domain-containing protein [Yamadazyma tenuis ATCC 10573]EGV64197.1 actin-like ATPase domain-containing protein [Yamadazyma tenuis ATCC 10573]WEJ96139.1 Actin-like protein arp9 (SWI/SNF complex component arp9) [Yamadazyma tenuis]